VSLRYRDDPVEVTYHSRRDGSFQVGAEGVARVRHWSMAGIDVEINSRRAAQRVTRSREHLYMQSVRGTVTFDIVPRFVAPGSDLEFGGLNAPMPGAVIDVRVVLGQFVASGETLVVMEAMKMEHVISAPHAGTVSAIFVTIGQQVDNGAVLLTLDADEGDDHESRT
jgi:acetyl/propionyl-CoA carboxylase alpha subunit